MSDKRLTVEEAINQDVFLQELLARDLQNRKAVARWLMKYRGVEGDEDRIVSAIRRMELPERTSLFDAAKEALVDVKVGIQGPVTVLVLKRNEETSKLLNQILGEVKLERRMDIVRFLPSPSSLMAVIEEDQEDDVRDILGEDLIKKTRRGMMEISFELPENDESIAGVLGLVYTFMEQRGIHVLKGFIAAEYEFLLVNEEDAEEAVEAIETLIVAPGAKP